MNSPFAKVKSSFLMGIFQKFARFGMPQSCLRRRLIEDEKIIEDSEKTKSSHYSNIFKLHDKTEHEKLLI